MYTESCSSVLESYWSIAHTILHRMLDSSCNIQSGSKLEDKRKNQGKVFYFEMFCRSFFTYLFDIVPASENFFDQLEWYQIEIYM